MRTYTYCKTHTCREHESHFFIDINLHMKKRKEKKSYKPNQEHTDERGIMGHRLRGFPILHIATKINKHIVDNFCPEKRTPE